MPSPNPATGGTAPPTMTVSLRFYEELNDFIAAGRRYRTFELAGPAAANVKHVIEAVGVPHTEVELILVNGVSVDFAARLRDGDRVAVYPKFESLDIAPLLRLRAHPLRLTRFVADAHLGGLARLLRMAGFDTLYDNHFDDAEIERIADSDGRIVLSRDRALLKRRSISHGCYVHAQEPVAQLAEILARLDLTGRLQPLSLCLACNVPLQPVAKAQVIDRLPPGVRERHQRFSACRVCQRIYWEGSHWQRMQEKLAQAVAAAGGSDSRSTIAVTKTGLCCGQQQKTAKIEIRPGPLAEGNTANRPFFITNGTKKMRNRS